MTTRKGAKNVGVFISYKRKTDLSVTDIALSLAKQLEQFGYDVFLDRTKLAVSDDWAEMIYKHIFSSDVLIVLVEPEAAESDWIQREVDVARGAHVSILPLQVAPIDNIRKTLERLALGHYQLLPFSGGEGDYPGLLKEIDRLCAKSRATQRQWFRGVETRWRVRHAAKNKAHAAYTLREDANPCTIYIATGDITELTDIDVIVNTENDYMQMGRIYERSTLSSSLRRAGALFDEATGRLIEDTVQKELDTVLVNPPYGTRPVRMMTVIPTPAGHPQSRLAQETGARYIFHAAAVQVADITRDEVMVPIGNDAGIRQVVLNCLNTVIKVDSKQGIISPLNTEQRSHEETEAENYQPIRSIVFPLFGTGHGGRSVAEVIHPMLDGMRDFLVEQDGSDLKLDSIYVSVYSSSDLGTVENAMSEVFDPAPVAHKQHTRRANP